MAGPGADHHMGEMTAHPPRPVRTACLLAFALMLPALPAGAQENPLLRPSPLAPQRLSPAPGRLDPVEQEKARAYRDSLQSELYDRQRLDAFGRLPLSERRDLFELQGEANRIGRVLRRPGESPAGVPNQGTEVERILSGEAPLPGSEALPRLGRGGATLKPGQRVVPPDQAPDSGQTASGPQELGSPGGRMEFGWGGPSRPVGQ